MKLPHQSGLPPVVSTDGVTKEYVSTLAQRDYFIAGTLGEQTTNLSAGNHVEFLPLKSRGTSITLSSGTGQEQGIFTLAGGKIWKGSEQDYEDQTEPY